MRRIAILGIVLIAVGILVLAYEGITYTKNDEKLDLGDVEFHVKEKETIKVPQVVGGIAIAGGLVLLIAGRKK